MNPNRAALPRVDLEKENQTKDGNPSKKVQRTGLYAYMIWDNIRDETTDRLKIFDLDKELQVIWADLKLQLLKALKIN